MKQHISGGWQVRKNEAIAFCNVEPLDSAGDFKQAGGVGSLIQPLVLVRIMPHPRGFVPHTSDPFAMNAALILTFKLTLAVPVCASAKAGILMN
jgi:hypothetical protein